MKIKNIKTKWGTEVELGTLTILVGPNNVGKSQTLRDIHSYIAKNPDSPRIIIDEVHLDMPSSLDELIEGLEKVPHPSSVGHHIIRGLSSNLLGAESTTIQDNLDDQIRQSGIPRNWIPNFGKFRVAFLDTESRLRLVQTGPSHNPEASPPSSLLQALYVDETNAEGKLCDAFQKIFNRQIKLDYSALQNLCLRLGKDFSAVPDDPKKALRILKHFQKLDNQGDGFRSFVGTMLGVLVSSRRIFLIDEPEAFLHPTQAKALGTWLGDYLAEQDAQVLIATHSAPFLIGVVASKATVKVLRVDRNDDVTTFREISADAMQRLSHSPLLSNQTIVSSLFHKGVCICESDSDRLFYETILNYRDPYADILFVHAHNKQTIYKVVQLLKESGAPVACIVDIDILDDSEEFRKLTEKFLTGDGLESVIRYQDQINTTVKGMGHSMSATEMETNLRALADRLSKDTKDTGENIMTDIRRELKILRKDSSEWAQVKKSGITCLPEGVSEIGERLLSLCKEKGLFIVPVGELESWMDIGTRNKQKWIVRALEKIHDEGPPKAVTDFLNEVAGYLS